MYSFQAVDQKECCPVNMELAIVRGDKGWNIPRIGEKKQPCRSFFELGKLRRGMYSLHLKSISRVVLS
jgi:hypothetical protein